jgi:hypothetical protein
MAAPRRSNPARLAEQSEALGQTDHQLASMSDAQVSAEPNAAESPAGVAPRSEAPTTPGQAGHRVHRVLVPSLLALGTIVAVVAMFAVWCNRQLLNTDNWTNTSARVLADSKVQAGLSSYLVDQIFSHVNVQKEVQGLLPGRAALLAQPAAAGLRDLADRAVPQILASAPVQSAWQIANRLAHRTFVKVINGGSRYVSTTDGAVKLNLGTVARDVARGVGINANISGGQIVVFRSDKLKTAQTVARVVQHLAVWAPLVALAFFLGGVALARDWRRRALRDWGLCLVGAGLATILLRRIIGHWAVNHQVRTVSLRPAADSVWFIGTSLLNDIAIAVLVYGLLVVVAAWLAGPGRVPVAIRRALAPGLRLHPVMAYGVVALLFVLVVLWGPTPAFRQVIPVLLFALLIAVGMVFWAREISSEFPDARPGESLAIVRSTWTDWGESWRRGARLPGRRHEVADGGAEKPEAAHGGPARAPSPALVPATAAAQINGPPVDYAAQTIDPPSRPRSQPVHSSPAPVVSAIAPRSEPATIEQLERLSALYSRGQLSDEEFTAAKAQMISSL